MKQASWKICDQLCGAEHRPLGAAARIAGLAAKQAEVDVPVELDALAPDEHQQLAEKGKMAIQRLRLDAALGGRLAGADRP